MNTVRHASEQWVANEYAALKARVDSAGATVVKSGTTATITIKDTNGNTTTASVSDGETGAVGPANKLSIGTVTKGDTASATITGTAPNQTLNLVLPKGDKGEQGTTSWNDLTDKPETFTPSAHTQAASTITGLATVATSGSYNDLGNKPTIPNAYDDTAVKNRLSAIEGQESVWTAKQDKLVAGTGIAIADDGKTISATVTGGVTSVNEKTGAVVLDASDVGAAAAEHNHKQADVEGLADALAAKRQLEDLDVYTLAYCPFTSSDGHTLNFSQKTTTGIYWRYEVPELYVETVGYENPTWYLTVQTIDPEETSVKHYVNDTAGEEDLTIKLVNIEDESDVLTISRSYISEWETVYGDSIGKKSDITADATHAKSISLGTEATKITPDATTGDVDVSTLFSSENTSLTGTIDNSTDSKEAATGAQTIELETRVTKTIDWSGHTSTDPADTLTISFKDAPTGQMRYCELLITNVTASTIDLAHTGTLTFKSADSTALAPEAGDNLLVFAEYATNCFIVSRQVLSTVTD